MNNKLFAEIAREATDVQGSLLAMLWLLVYYSNESGECWPRMSKVAKHCHMSERQAYRQMKQLEKKGYVRVKQRGTPVSPPVYRITVPKAGDVGDVTPSVTRATVLTDIVRGGSLTSRVPEQAGTNINQNINNKGLTVTEDIKRERRKCGVRGCARVTFDEFCHNHVIEDSRK